MHILLVGLNHKTAPLEVREAVTFTKEQLPQALSALSEQIGESVILSTCNRTEFYCATESPPATSDRIRRFVCDFQGLEPEDVSPFLYEYSDLDASRHLFRVASGLDSMIIGESEILGQVRDALAAGSESSSLNVSLVGLFHAAIRSGRRVREETDVGRNPLSISYAAVKLAQRVVGPLNGLRVLLVGAGEAGELVAKALRTVGVSDLVITSRTGARGEQLARSLAGRAVPFAEMEATLGGADILIAATDAPDFVITKQMVAAAAQRERQGPLFVFDLAVPRDVEPGVAEIDNVKLFNIDHLSAIAEENLEQRQQAATAGEAIVEDELRRFSAWWESLDAVPIIRELQQQAEEIRSRELERALAMMPDLPEAHQKTVDALTQAIVKKLLHDPTLFLREGASKSQLQAVRNLFRLWEES